METESVENGGRDALVLKPSDDLLFGVGVRSDEKRDRVSIVFVRIFDGEIGLFNGRVLTNVRKSFFSGVVSLLFVFL